MSWKLCGTERNSYGHYPQDVMAEVKTQIDSQIEVGTVR